MGRGYATEAAAASLEHGLGPLALPRVRARVAPGNAGSIRVLEKIGMRPLGATEVARAAWLLYERSA